MATSIKFIKMEIENLTILKMSKIGQFFGLTLVATFLLCNNALAQYTVAIKPDLKKQGISIPADFSGIAYEISEVTPGNNNKYYFSPQNKPLLHMVKTLGIKNIRIGGNTADLQTFKFPDQTDIDSLFLFAKVAGVKINYTFRLRNGNIDSTAILAKYIYDHYKSSLACFAIGNEPDFFNKTYEDYKANWILFYNAILKVAPDAKFCGPNIAGRVDWPAKFLNDFGKTGHIVSITLHTYPGGAGDGVKDPAKAIDEMLSREWLKKYEHFFQIYNPVPKIQGLPYRIEEINNYYNGGARHVSDTYASALWSLDYLYWWASHQMGGINFQNGDSVAKGKILTPCKYAAFVTTDNGYFARPSAYGIKAFDLGSHGRIIPADVICRNCAVSDTININTYCIKGSDKSLNITVLNKEHGKNGKYVKLNILIDAKKYHKCKVLFLKAPENNVAAESGITLGGSPIKENGSWKEKWISIKIDKHSKTCHVLLPKASAVILKFFK